MVLHGFWLLKEASETMGFLCPIKPMSVSDLWTPIKDEYHRTHALRELGGFFLFLFFFFCHASQYLSSLTRNLTWAMAAKSQNLNH